jgi:hypothetical protein
MNAYRDILKTLKGHIIMGKPWDYGYRLLQGWVRVEDMIPAGSPLPHPCHEPFLPGLAPNASDTPCDNSIASPMPLLPLPTPSDHVHSFPDPLRPCASLLRPLPTHPIPLLTLCTSVHPCSDAPQCLPPCWTPSTFVSSHTLYPCGPRPVHWSCWDVLGLGDMLEGSQVFCVCSIHIFYMDSFHCKTVVGLCPLPLLFVMPCCYPVCFTDLLLSFLECPSIPSYLVLCFSLTYVYICPSTLPIIFLSNYCLALYCAYLRIRFCCLPVRSLGQVSLPDHC